MKEFRRQGDSWKSNSARVADELSIVQHSPKHGFRGLPWEERSLLGQWRGGIP